jgi:3-oxoacyl-[acyl-carrier-protein] synthase II
MEELGHAMKRNANIYGEILGFGAGNDASDLFGINSDSTVAATCFKQALVNAHLNPEDIDYINAHGNAYLQYDICETQAIKEAFGECAYQIPISSIKPITGQSLSPTGIFQVMTCLLTIRDGVIPPTTNLVNPHPQCDLNYIRSQPTNKEVRKTVMNAQGFGGRHTVLVVGKYFR